MNDIRAKTFAQLPLSSCPFKLSITYIHLFLSRYQLEVFYQAYSHLKNYAKAQVEAKEDGKLPRTKSSLLYGSAVNLISSMVITID